MPRKFPDSYRLHAIQLYESGLSLLLVSQKMGVSIEWVDGVVLSTGIARSRAEAAKLRFKRERPHNTYLDLPVAEIVRRYQGGGGVLDIARDLGISSRPVFRILEEQGVARRSLADTQRLIGRKKALAIAKARPDHVGWGEEKVQAWLAERGEVADSQHPSGTRNIDIAIPPIAVEVWLSANSPFTDTYCRDRIKDLSDRGWVSYYVWVARRTRILLPTVADQLVAWIQEGRRNPTAPREHRVIRGCGELAATASYDLDQITRIPPSVDCPHHSSVNKRLRR